MATDVLAPWPFWYQTCRINRSLSSTRKDINYLCNLDVEKLKKCKCVIRCLQYDLTRKLMFREQSKTGTRQKWMSNFPTTLQHLAIKRIISWEFIIRCHISREVGHEVNSTCVTFKDDFYTKKRPWNQKLTGTIRDMSEFQFPLFMRCVIPVLSPFGIFIKNAPNVSSFTTLLEINPLCKPWVYITLTSST